MQCDPARVRRSLSLHVEQLGGSEYVVTGGREPHVVDTSGVPWECDCADARFNPGPCKHTTAVYFVQQLAQPVRAALRSALGAA